MKKKSNIILLIILTFLAIFITTIMIYFLINKDIKNSFFKINYNNKKNLIYNKIYEENDLDKINIDVSTTDIFIKSTEDNKIKLEVFGEKDDKVNSKISNNILNISKTSKSDFCIGFCFHNSDEIVLYFPKNLVSNLNINSEYGDILVEDFENINAQIETETGDITFGNLNDAYIETESGDVKIKSLKNGEINTETGDIIVTDVLNKIDIESETGDIKIKNCNIKENSKIEVDTGDVTIIKINDIYIDTKTDTGEVNIKKNNRYSKIEMKIETDSGDIKVN